MKNLNTLFGLFSVVTLMFSANNSYAQNPPEKVFCPEIKHPVQAFDKYDRAEKDCSGQYTVYTSGTAFDDSGRSWGLMAANIDSEDKDAAIQRAKDRTQNLNQTENQYALPIGNAYYCSYDSVDGSIVTAFTSMQKSALIKKPFSCQKLQ